jgi:hypothetical protein
MKVTLSSGLVIVLLGPVVTDTAAGVMVSHRQFNAIVGGKQATITIEELEGAEFPEAVQALADEAFDASLDDVRARWRIMARNAGLSAD